MLIIFVIALVGALGQDLGDPATNQVLYFRAMEKGPVGTLTVSSGASVCENDLKTLNTSLIRNSFFMDSLTHLNRERTPERVVHGKGSGAFGYFKATKNISHICKASFLKLGTKTPVAVRFSPAVGEKGFSDLSRGFQGFAVKLYTREGNLDIPGFNTPVYIYKDPIYFSNFVHGVRRNPATNLYDPNIFWDAMIQIPGSMNMLLRIFSDRGIPAAYQNMPGFGIHRYQVEAKTGESHLITINFFPDAGIENLTTENATAIAAVDPDYYTRRLFSAIASSNYPTWTCCIQIIPVDDIKKKGEKLLDVTRYLSSDEYPYHEIGKLVLNRNPTNFYAEIEQLAFCPSNLVPGIIGAPDKIYESRQMAYRDAHVYRLGPNVNKIPVNCPFQVKTFTVNRDGSSPVGDNENDIPNYYPSSFNGPVPLKCCQSSKLIDIVENEPDNYDQVSKFYEVEMVGDERDRFIKNIVDNLKQAAKDIQDKTIKLFKNINEDMGNRVEEALNSAWSN